MPSAQALQLSNLLRESIIQLCKVGITFKGQVEVDAILCIASEAEDQEVVVKIHEKFLKTPLSLSSTKTSDYDGGAPHDVTVAAEQALGKKQSGLLEAHDDVCVKRLAQSEPQSEYSLEVRNEKVSRPPFDELDNYTREEHSSAITQAKSKGRVFSLNTTTARHHTSNFSNTLQNVSKIPSAEEGAPYVGGTAMEVATSDIPKVPDLDKINAASKMLLSHDISPGIPRESLIAALGGVHSTLLRGLNIHESGLGSISEQKLIAPSVASTSQANLFAAFKERNKSNENLSRNNDLNVASATNLSGEAANVMSGDNSQTVKHMLGPVLKKNPKLFTQLSKKKSLRGSAAFPLPEDFMKAVQARKAATHTSLTCEICKTKCDTIQDFCAHNERQHGKHVCPHCYALFQEHSELEEHLCHHDSHVCLVCDKAFHSNSELKLHRFEEHTTRRKNTGKFDLYNCAECASCFPNHKNLKSHFSSNHGMSLEFFCGPCFSGFGGIDQFVQHRLEGHATQKVLMCPDCDFSSYSKLDFVKHWSHHKCPTTYICQCCHNEFHDPSDYSCHVLKDHSPEDIPWVQCTLCLEMCETIQEWMKHEQAHVGTHTFTCVQCSDCIKSVPDLRIHVRTHDNTFKPQKGSGPKKEYGMSGGSASKFGLGKPCLDRADDSCAATSKSQEEALNLISRIQHQEGDEATTSHKVDIGSDDSQVQTCDSIEYMNTGQGQIDHRVVEISQATLNAASDQTISLSTESTTPFASTSSQGGLVVHIPATSLEPQALSIKIPIQGISSEMSVLSQGQADVSSLSFATSNNLDTGIIEIKDSPGSDDSSMHSNSPTVMLMKAGRSRKSTLESLVEQKRQRKSDDTGDGEIQNPEIPQLYTCTLCPFECADYGEYESHAMSIHGRLSCKYCTKLFGNKANRERHINLHTGEKPFKCPECGEGFIRGDTMRMHRIKAHHLSVEETYTYTKYANQKSCSDVEASTSSNQSDVNFNRTSNIFGVCNSDSQKDMESTEQPDVCVVENVAPQDEIHSEARVDQSPYEAVGPDEYPIEIDVMEEDDFSSMGQIDHMSHGFDPDRTFRCEVCQENIVTWEAFDNHTVQHGRFPCPYCGKLYTQKGNRDRHMRLHTGEKPYKCPFCPLRYRRKENLNHHKEKQHPNS